jgi:hypothetical protein
MKKQLIPALLAAMFAFGGLSVYAYAADQPVGTAGEASANVPGNQGDPMSPEKKHKKAGKTAKTGGLPPCAGQGAPVNAPAGEAKCNPEATAAVPGNQGAPTGAKKTQ